MKSCKYLILTVTLIFFGFQSQGPEERLIQKNIPAPSLSNNLFDTPTEQPVLIYLPPSYHTSKKRYPVVYFLPGFTTKITEMIDGTFQGLNIQKAMDDLVAAGSIQEMIFVVANGRNFLGGSFYVNSHVTPMGWNRIGAYLGCASLLHKRDDAVNRPFDLISSDGDIILDIQKKFLAALFSLDGSKCDLKKC